MLARVAFILCFSTTVSFAGLLFGSDTLTRPSRSYDVLHYKLELRFDEANKKVMGTTTMSFVPLRSKLDSIVLNAVEMDVASVRLSRGKSLRFGNNKQDITVFLDRSYGFGDTLSIAVEYSVQPKHGLFFLSPDSTNPKRHNQIWTQGEDMYNRYWFPCWDFPNDKASSEVIATVKDSWSLLSNGKLLDVKHDKKNKTKTFHWYQAKPHVSYLIMLAAGEYDIHTEQYKNFPLEYYVYKERSDDGRRAFSVTPKVMQFFEEAFGYPYPWDKFSQIFIDDFMWGGMENTSAVTYNTSYMLDPRAELDFTSDDVVAHELAHQWFGDVVTTRDWTHLWLNEGFANYAEALFKRYAKGQDEFQLDMKGQADAVLGVERAQGRKPVISTDSYTGNLYSKGAWVLYMLENLIGEQEFRRSVALYLRKNAFTSVSTQNFKDAVEEATGHNLDWFFDQWLLKAGHPKLTVTSSWDDQSKKLAIIIQQTQTLDSLTGVFVLPLDIECTTSTGKTLTNVWLTKQEEKIEIALPEKPQMVIADKGMKILKSLTFEKSKEEYVYQLLHAEDVFDRIAAAKALKPYPDDESVYSALKHAALNDAFWAVRREATIYLGTMKNPGAKSAMFEIYKDEKSAVRNAAIVALEKFPGDDVASFLKTCLKNDSSYIVQSSCLQSLAEVDSLNAFSIASEYVDKDSHRDILRRGALQVFRTVRAPAALSYASKYVRLGNPGDIRSLALGVLREVGEKDAASRELVISLTGDVNTIIRKGAIRTLGMWGGEDAIAALEKRKDLETEDDVKKSIQSALDEITKN